MKSKDVLCLVAALALAPSTDARTQSLADLAKVEKERQAKVRSSGATAKVFTAEIKTETAGGTAGTTPVDGAAGQGGAPKDVAPAGSNKGKPLPPGVGPPGGHPGSSRPRVSSKDDNRSSRNVSVTLYVTSWCGYCRKARAFLASLPNVRVVEHDIEENKSKHAEMLAKTGGRKGVPVIDVEGDILQGFSESSITKALAGARHR